MDLTETQKQLQKDLRDFAEAHFRKDLMRDTREARFPIDEYQEVARAGYMGFMVPPEYGGRGGGVTEYCILLDELARVNHNVAWAIDVTVAVASAIRHLGTEAQRRRLLPRLMDGSLIPAFALSDLTGGSSLKQMGTRVTRHTPGGWRLTGRKTHIHNAEVAQLWLVFAGSEDGHEALLIEGRDLIVIERRYQPFGFRCVPCNQVLFDGVPVGDEDFLGERGKGLSAAMHGTLNYTRIGNASIVLGIARAALDVAMSFALARDVGKGLLAQQQAVQHMIADAMTRLQAADLLRWRATYLHDQQRDAVMAASQAKLFATDTASEICGSLFRLLGAYGVYEEFPMTDYINSCKTMELASGASEVHRNNIARLALAEYERRFEAGELFRWAQTEEQIAMLMSNQRSAQVMQRLRQTE
ncbi:MAG: acyl-CoA dehydrogenase family protein [Lautropia sp.]